MIVPSTLTFNYDFFDAHVHFRNPRTPLFDAVVPFTASTACGAVIMPNLVPFLVKADMVKGYEAAIREKVGDDFILIMTGYLTEDTTAEDIRDFDLAGVRAMKAYPRGATTNSHGGIANFRNCAKALREMENRGMILLVHPELNTDGAEEVDPYDREWKYIESVLMWLVMAFPYLKKIVEHVTDRRMAAFIERFGGEYLACTVTAHHAAVNRKDFFRDGPDVHLHCWPILKRERDMLALRRLITRGFPFVFAGTDSAPHPTHAKERACGCAGGVFTAHAWYSMYITIFKLENATKHIEGFLCTNGLRFYGIEPKQKQTTVENRPWHQDKLIEVSDGSSIFPFGYHPKMESRTTFYWWKKK